MNNRPSMIKQSVTLRRTVAALLLTAGFPILQPASAQTTADGELGLSEVVVTATRRAENLQDVPISLTVVSGDDLAATGVLNTADLAQKVPNLNYANTGPLPVFAIRGVQLLEIIALGNEPPVAAYFDDVYVGSLAGQSAQVFDVESVQVLRGPQGTLFGRNATGGLVHYTSRRPTKETEGYATVRVGDYGQRILEGAVGGSLSDNLRARLSASYNRDDGYQRNLAPAGGNFAKTDQFAVRLMTELDLGESASALLKLHHSKIDNQSALYGSYGRLNNTVQRQVCAPALIFAAQCVNRDGFKYVPSPTIGYTEQTSLPTKIDATGASLTLRWNLDLGELVSISSWDSFERFYAEDVDGTAAPRFLATYNEDAKQFSQELRLAGSTGTTKYVVGGYFFDDVRETEFALPQLIAQLVPLLGPKGGTAGLRNRADVDTRSWALFGQIDQPVSETVTATLGLRYTDEKKSLFMSDNPQQPLSPLLQIIRRSVQDEKVTGTVGLGWRPADDVLVYGSYARGYKSGAFNTRGGVYSTLNSRGFVPNVFVGAEESATLEIGAKAEFADNRVRLNASVFDTDYQNVQVTAVDRSIPDVLLSNLVNAGDATIRGGEIELTAIAAEGLTVGLGVGLLDTELKSTTEINGLPLNGRELPKAPDWSVNGYIRYVLPTTVAGGRLTLQTDFKKQAEEWTSPENIGEERQDGYEVYNFRLGWESDSGKYSAAVFVENAFDEKYYSFTFQSFDYVDALWQKPRWMGASFTVKF